MPRLRKIPLRLQESRRQEVEVELRRQPQVRQQDPDAGAIRDSGDDEGAGWEARKVTTATDRRIRARELSLRSDYLFVRNLRDEELTDGGIYLPDGRPSLFDGTVLGYGPETPGAYTHDRVIGPRAAFRWLQDVDVDGERHEEGFAEGRHLIAVIPFPGHAEIKPLGPWVCIAQDRRTYTDEASGATVRRDSGQILVAEGTPVGQEIRDEMEVEDRLTHIRALTKTEKWKLQPNRYYRQCMVNDYMADAPNDIRFEVSRRMVEQDYKFTWRDRVPWHYGEGLRSGILAGCGPLVDPLVRQALGRRVHWDRETLDSYYVSAGGRGLAFVKGSAIVGVEDGG
jgi:hypothetical protein